MALKATFAEMKKILLCVLLLSYFNSHSQTISIDSARALPIASVVTVQGIVLCNNELGNSIRYIDDGSAGIAIYSNLLSGVNQGDEISVTGQLSDFNGLLEITNLTANTTISTGNALPTPILLTPAAMGEDFEGRLVRIDNATFNNPSGNFSGAAYYQFTGSGEQGEIYLRGSHPLVGTAIPTSNCDLIGICSQYNSYQLLPRTSADVIAAPFYFTVPPHADNITNSGLDILFETNLSSNSFVEYGLTPLLELGYVQGTTNATSHIVSMNGFAPSQIFYARAFAVSGLDTAFTDVHVYITASVSSGTMKVYFTRTVNNTVALPGNNAIQLNQVMADTIAAYIDRAQNTLDIAIYNFNDVSTSAIATAINNAYGRGVQVRMIYDGSNANTGLSLLNSNIKKIPSPDSNTSFYYGIMHNKFMVIDVANANTSIVWSGSTNWTGDQLNIDANNAIAIQDKSLAIAYTMEFEEMWGSNSANPDTANSKWGPDKVNNTPHEFLIAGIPVQCYFSPSDNANAAINDALNSANTDLYFSLLVFTRTDLANTILNKINNGVYVAGLINDLPTGTTTPYTILSPLMNDRLQQYNSASLSGINHHKVSIVDQSQSSSDALITTGSHNWSTSANTTNDENELVIHSQLIANQYFQEFYQRMSDQNIFIGMNENNKVLSQAILYPNPTTSNIYLNVMSHENSKASIAVSDICGKEMINKSLFFETGSNKILLDEELSSGIYIVTINSNGEKLSLRFVKQ